MQIESRDQPNNNFCQKTESMQYNAALAITEAIKGTSQTKLYKELGLQMLKFSRHWLRRFCNLLKTKISGLPKYLLKLIPQENFVHNTYLVSSIPKYHCRTDSFEYYFSPFSIFEWNKLDFKKQLLKQLFFQISLLKIGRPPGKQTFNIHKPTDLKFLTRSKVVSATFLLVCYLSLKEGF